MKNPLGIYEKALPASLGLREKLRAAAEAGFDFMELSIDESPERLARLDSGPAERLDLLRAAGEVGIRVPSVCLSGHRRFPFGSADSALRSEALKIMEKALRFASDAGIRVIQLAGYDVYYERPTRESRDRFLQGMELALGMAARYQVTLALEIMDTSFLNSISKYLVLKERLRSPWLAVYPDLGNLSAWGNDVARELELGVGDIVGVHVKETRAVGPGFPGAFRDLAFGEGDVDFECAFSALSRLGYEGPFLIEMWTEKAAEPLAEIARAKDWVLDRLTRSGFAG